MLPADLLRSVNRSALCIASGVLLPSDRAGDATSCDALWLLTVCGWLTGLMVQAHAVVSRMHVLRLRLSLQLETPALSCWRTLSGMATCGPWSALSAVTQYGLQHLPQHKTWLPPFREDHPFH